MGGASDVISRPLSSPFELSYDGGNLNTHELSGGASDTWRRFAVSGFARAFTTDGYFIVPKSVRGSIDTRAAAEFIPPNTRVAYFDNTNRLFVPFDMSGDQPA